MSLNHFEDVQSGLDAKFEIGCLLLDTDELKINRNPVTGTYDASISVTGGTNLADPQKTHYMRLGATVMLFGWFRCDVSATSTVDMEINLLTGTSISLANRAVSLVSNNDVAGAKAFITSSDGNVTTTRMNVTTRTYDGSNAVPGDQIGTEFYYNIIYISQI